MATTAVGNNVTLEEVLLRVSGLEERIAALEKQAGPLVARSESVSPPRTAALATPGKVDVGFAGGYFATVAKALLVFAGAYLLRAVSESGFAPGISIIAGLAYALFWLVWPTRAGAEDGFGTTVYGLTATMIFSGIVWETCVQMHALTPIACAALILLFTFIGILLGRRRALPAISGIVTIIGASLAAALMLATDDVIPFAAATLAIGAAAEFSACRGLGLQTRWFPALTADILTFIAAWLITQPQGLPESYHPFDMSSVAALQIMLVLIYGLAMAYRTLITGGQITTFEIAQNALACALFIWGSVVMGREAPAAHFFVEAFCMVAGLSCYATAVLLLARQSRQRNFLMYSLFGLALLMAGISILCSGQMLVLVWCLLAVVLSYLGTHEHRISLQLHAPVLLAAAAMWSGLMAFARQALHGANAPSAARLIEIVIVTAALALCYWMAGAGDSGKERIPALLIAGLLCWALLGLGGAGITSLLGPDSSVSSTLRTGLICGLSLVLAKAKWHRSELMWLIYPLMLYGAYRLLVEDFPSGRPAALALSLLFYGGTLLLLTRMLREDATHAPR